MVVPMCRTLVIDTYGWRMAYPILGGGRAAVCYWSSGSSSTVVATG